MTETEISTPVETVTEDTSTIVEPETTDTSTVEPEVTDTAETETKAEEVTEERLYAGKYKSIEDLEKGYNEAQKSVAKASEFEKKYNELVQKQQAEIERIAQQQLQQAQREGYRTAEEKQIADIVREAEANEFINALSLVDTSVRETVGQYLDAYRLTRDTQYLEAIKPYYPIRFIEQVANDKTRYENQLRGEYEAQQRQRANEQEAQLAEVLKADYAEFLADVQQNEGKAQALKSFCDVGSITCKEDMQVFHDIYNKIAKYERELAIKEYEAAKAIEETKNKSQIDGGVNNVILDDGSLTYAQIERMSQEEFNKAFEKYGAEAIINAK